MKFLRIAIFVALTFAAVTTAWPIPQYDDGDYNEEESGGAEVGGWKPVSIPELVD